MTLLRVPTPSIRRRTIPAMMTAITIRATVAVRTPPRYGAMGRFRDVTVQLDRLPVPRPSLGEVLVRVRTVAVCGTDLHAVQHDDEVWCMSSAPAAGWDAPGGMVLGHEYAGEVVQVGAGVDPCWLGALVTGDSLVPCGVCEVCTQGQPNHCPQAWLLGLERQGAFGDYTVVPVRSLCRIESLVRRFGNEAFLVGCLAEPLGVAAKAVREGHARLPRRAPWSLLIHGGGPIRLFAAQVALQRGFDPVAVVEPNPDRRSLATLVASHVFATTEDDRARCRQLFGAGPGLAVDACGQVSLDELCDVLRPAGVVVLLARTGTRPELPLDDLITDGVTLVGSRGHVGHLRWVVRQMARGKIDPRPLVTHRLRGLAELADWLVHSERFARAGKVVCALG